MAVVIDISIAMTVATAIDNALADATGVVIVHPYQEKEGQNMCFFALGLDMAIALAMAMAMARASHS